MTPAFTKNLIERRNKSDHPTTVFVSIGWPSGWLREYVEKSLFAKNAVIVAVLQSGAHDLQSLRGLSVCVWCERAEDEPRAHEIAAQIMAHAPLRLYTLNAMTGETTWHRVAGEQMEAA